MRIHADTIPETNSGIWTLGIGPILNTDPIPFFFSSTVFPDVSRKFTLLELFYVKVACVDAKTLHSASDSC